MTEGDPKSPVVSGEVVRKGTAEWTELEKIRSISISALKIVTAAAVSDEETSSDFFASPDNYLSMARKLRDAGLADSNLPSEEDVFLRNPIRCWIMLISILFVTIHSLGIAGGGIECDVITSSDVEGERGMGVYYSTLLRLEFLDWSEHRVDLFIPSERDVRTVFAVDDEPVLFAVV